MTNNIDFKDYLEEVFQEKFIEIQKFYIDKTSVPDSKFAGSSFVDHTNYYGDQDIFKQYTREFLFIVKQIFDDGYKPELSELLLYAGHQRYELSKAQGKRNREMGEWRDPYDTDSVLVDYINKYRYINAFRLIDRFLDSGLPTNKPVKFEGTLFKFKIDFLPEENPELDKAIIQSYASDGTHQSALEIYFNSEKCLKMEDRLDCGLYVGRTPDDKYYRLLDSLYQKCIYTRKLDDIAKLHWHLCRRVPHIRGGGAIAEWISAALMIYSGYNFRNWSSHVFLEPWSVAITSGVERFIELYPDISNLSKEL